MQNKLLQERLESPIENSARQIGHLEFFLLGAVFVVLFGAIEFLNRQISGVVGILAYFALLFLLIYTSIYFGNHQQRRFWLALGIVPVIRIVTISAPIIVQIAQIFWYVFIYIPILVAIIALGRYFKYNLEDMGLTFNRPFVQIIVGLSGIGLGYLDYLILKPAALTPFISLPTIIVPSIVLLVFTGLIEELAFRGILQKAADLSSKYGWVLVSAAYAVIQISYANWYHCAFIFGVGLFYGLVVKRSGSILGVGISHGLLNISLLLIYPHIV